MQIFKDFLLPNDSFIPELGQHLQHVDADLLWVIIQTSTDDAKAVRWPCSLSVWYCWYFSYSLFDICFMMTSKNKYSRVRTRLHLKARTSLFYQKTSPRHYAAASRIKDVVQFSILWSSLIKRGSLTTENGSMGALALLYSFGWSGPK